MAKLTLEDVNAMSFDELASKYETFKARKDDIDFQMGMISDKLKTLVEATTSKETEDKKIKVHHIVTAEYKSLDTAKAKTLIKNWKEKCFKVSASKDYITTELIRR